MKLTELYSGALMGGGNWANAQSKFKTALLKIRLNTTNYELIFSLFIILLFLTEE